MEELGFDYIWRPGWEGIKKEEEEAAALDEPSAHVKGNRAVSASQTKEKRGKEGGCHKGDSRRKGGGGRQVGFVS